MAPARGSFGLEVLREAAAARRLDVRCLQDVDDSDPPTGFGSGSPGATALVHAASKGSLIAVKYLVDECGAAVDAADCKGRTSLAGAASAGSLDLVHYLAGERGASVDLEDPKGSTALMTAAEQGHLDVVSYLAGECRATTDATNVAGHGALAHAARAGHLDVVRYLAERGAVIDMPDAQGRTPLMHAACRGHADIVCYLASAADPNAVDANGQTSLMLAAYHGHLDVVSFLADEQRAIMDMTDASGRNALMLAARQGHLDLVRSLAGKGGLAVNTADASGATALMFAATRGHLDIVSYLAREHGAATDVADANGCTPLMLAAGQGQLDVVRYLAGSRGASIDATDAAGHTALVWARVGGHLDTERYLASLEHRIEDARTRAESHLRSCIRRAASRQRGRSAPGLRRATLRAFSGPSPQSTEAGDSPAASSAQATLSPRRPVEPEPGELCPGEAATPSREVRALQMRLQEQAITLEEQRSQVSSLELQLSVRGIECSNLTRRNVALSSELAELRRAHCRSGSLARQACAAAPAGPARPAGEPGSRALAVGHSTKFSGASRGGRGPAATSRRPSAGRAAGDLRPSGPR